MPLSRPATDFDKSWAQEIAEEARTQFDGELTIRTPAAPGSYDPITGQTGPDTLGALILGPRPARAVPLRLPQESNDGNGSQSSRRYRFQCDILEGDPSITQGMVVYFTGGDDPRLERMSFQVKFASNGSHAAVRTIETVTEGDRG